MDSFEWNKIIGAVLGTLIFVFVVKTIAEVVYEAPTPAKPGYFVEGVIEPGGSATAPVAEVEPDFGTVLPAADVSAGKTVEARCAQCHDLHKGGPNKIGPELYGVLGRPRASHPGFNYSSAMMADHNPWTFALLFKYLRSPATMVPGTKMSFAGLRSAKDRINLLAYLRTQSDSPVAIPPPAPKVETPAPAAGEAKTPEGDKTKGEAPADAGGAASAKSDTAKTDKPATPAADSSAKDSAKAGPTGPGKAGK